MAISNKPWDGSASNYPDAGAYCDACLINTNTGDRADWSKDACKLPVKEANGDLNTNALGPAAGALNGARNALTDVTDTDKKVAARKLIGLYRQAKMDAPASLKAMA